MDNEQLKAEGFTNDFVVIEVVLDTLDVLIVFMALAGNEDDIAWLRHHTGCADSLATIYDTDYFALVFWCGDARKHIVNDVLRLLKTGIIGGDDYPDLESGGPTDR